MDDELLDDDLFKDLPETDETDLPDSVVPGHHAMTAAAFSWGDETGDGLPASIVPGHHAMAQAAFSWGDEGL